MKDRTKGLWVSVKEFFNQRVGTEVTRKEYLAAFPDANPDVLETYRCYLRRAGYMDSSGRGRYSMLKPVSSEATTAQVYLEAYPDRHEN